MWAYVVCAIIWAGFVVYWVTGSIPRRRVFEMWAGCGIGICLTLLVLGLAGWYRHQEDAAVWQILAAVGSVFYLLAILLVILSFTALGRRGQPEGFIERTTVLTDRGIFGVIRHPLYLGVALWSVALVLQIQSIAATALGAVAFLCAWMAARKEDEFNVGKFGERYREYMEEVPMWNVVKGLRRKRREIR
jgi:protein-S-isoprenylcysteine O-methyltransferase Ste14